MLIAKINLNKFHIASSHNICGILWRWVFLLSFFFRYSHRLVLKGLLLAVKGTLALDIRRRHFCDTANLENPLCKSAIHNSSDLTTKCGAEYVEKRAYISISVGVISARRMQQRRKSKNEQKASSKHQYLKNMYRNVRCDTQDMRHGRVY